MCACVCARDEERDFHWYTGIHLSHSLSFLIPTGCLVPSVSGFFWMLHAAERESAARRAERSGEERTRGSDVAEVKKKKQKLLTPVIPMTGTPTRAPSRQRREEERGIGSS